MKIHIPADWRDAVPVVHIPRHPLWMDAYRGAWDLLGQALAQPGTGDQPDAEAIIHYARYAFAALPLDAWLDHLCRTRLSPLHAWSEWSLFQVTGDSARLAQALPRLSGQYGRLQAVSQRAPYARIDLCAHQALAAEHIAHIARAVGASAEADAYEAEWKALATLIDQRCWDGSLEFYTDGCEDGSRPPGASTAARETGSFPPTGSLKPLKTVAGLWPLLAGIPSAVRAERLAAHLAAPAEFWRLHAFASLSADHPRYSERGDGLRGAVWPLHNYAIIKGLERYGLRDLARRAADNHLTTISHVYKETQSLWDNYAPDYIEPGNSARPDAPGTGVSAVALLLETILGLTPDAPGRTLHWRPTLHETYSVEGLRIGSAVVNLYVEPDAVNPARLRATLRTSAPLTLHFSMPTRDERLVMQGETTVNI